MIIFVSFIFIINISFIGVGPLHAHVIYQQKTAYVIIVLFQKGK